MGGDGRGVPRSTVTAPVVPSVWVTATASPSTAPAVISSVLAPPARPPLVTLTGRLRANGAPAGTFAQTRSLPAISTVTVRSKGSTGFSATSRVFSMVRPENTPSGSATSWLLPAIRTFSFVRPENAPEGSAVIRLENKSSFSRFGRSENAPSGTEPIWFQRRMSVFSADMSENTSDGHCHVNRVGPQRPAWIPFQAAALALSHTLNASFRNRLNVNLLRKCR